MQEKQQQTCNGKYIAKNVFGDGDWCWHRKPFLVNDETKKMVMCHIASLLHDFLYCTEYENIIFCWVMREQTFLDKIIANLDLAQCRLHIFSLLCSKTALIRRIHAEIETGKRTQDVIERALAGIVNYNSMRFNKIGVSNVSPADAAQKIKHIMEMQTNC